MVTGFMRYPVLLVIMLAGSFSFAGSGAEKMHVVASIKPLELLVAEIAGEKMDTSSLLTEGQSPHHYSLSIAARERLNGAQLLVWLGEDMEPFLKAVATQVPSLQWQMGANHNRAAHQHQHQHHHHNHTVSHVWLDPAGAIQVADRIAKRLSVIDPANQETYMHRVKRLDTKSKDMLSASQLETVIGDRRWVVDHDAYQGLVEGFRLPEPLIAAAGPEIAPGARHMYDLGKKLKPEDCFVVDVNHRKKWIDVFIKRHQLNAVYVDILGYSGEVSNYLGFLESIYDPIMECLAR